MYQSKYLRKKVRCGDIIPCALLDIFLEETSEAIFALAMAQTQKLPEEYKTFSCITSLHVSG